MSRPSHRPRLARCASTALACALAAGCGRSRLESGPALRLQRVVVYRNGVGYFERVGAVDAREVTFRVLQRDVNDFLATLVVKERGGSSVRAAAFPMPEEPRDGATPGPDARRTVRLALDGEDHDLVVGYAVETPIWRPSYRLVFSRERDVEVQAWGIVQNLSGEDWRDVRLSLVTGAPVSFRSELSRAVVPLRPMVTDEGAVIAAVPLAETTLAHDDPNARAAAAAPGGAQQALLAANAPASDAFGFGGLGVEGQGWGGGGTGEGTIGLGAVGTMGHGAGFGDGQGYGAGAGRGLRNRESRGPMVRAAPPSVSGALSPEAIRRVVLRNLGQVTHCYEQTLAMNPSAAGRVAVRFTIGPQGAVLASSTVENSVGSPSVGVCVAGAVQRWQFPAPEGGGTVDVTYPFNLQSADGAAAFAASAVPDPRPATSTPRSVAALAAVATQGGATRYDVAHPVTVPDHSATMVLLASRRVAGERMYLFAPDPGVPESSSHPFQVARFVNRTGATLERGPVAIFEDNAFLGQGMLEALPDGATTTVPYALQRAVAVERSANEATEGARLVSVRHGELTIERFTVRRATFHVRNGADEAVRVMVREALDGAELHEPPSGSETTNGNALVPVSVRPRAEGEVVVTSRRPFTQGVDLASDYGAEAIEQYLRDGAPAADVAAALRGALALQRELTGFNRERADTQQRLEDLTRGADETRENLMTIERNARAADLRAQLTARLARTATESDRLTRRIVELDVAISERRVRLSEAMRPIDVDTARPTTR